MNKCMYDILCTRSHTHHRVPGGSDRYGDCLSWSDAASHGGDGDRAVRSTAAQGLGQSECVCGGGGGGRDDDGTRFLYMYV